MIFVEDYIFYARLLNAKGKKQTGIYLSLTDLLLPLFGKN